MMKGGVVVEVFSAQGKDPVAKWKLSGQPSISKVSVTFIVINNINSKFYGVKTTVS